MIFMRGSSGGRISPWTPSRLCQSLRVEASLPIERRADDSGEVVVAGLPVERSLDPSGIGDERRRIAGAARAFAHGQLAADHLLHGMDDLAHARAAAVAAVEGR